MVTVFIWLRSLRPERLANTENFDSVAEYVAEIQTPFPLLSPPSWSAKVILASLSGQTLPLLEYWVYSSLGGLHLWVYLGGSIQRYTMMGEAKHKKHVLHEWQSPLFSTHYPVLDKTTFPSFQGDCQQRYPMFLRDPAQWTQIFLVGSIVVIALISVAALPVETFKGPWMRPWINALSFLILALVGFVMAALAARFQFSAVSIEGRGFLGYTNQPYQCTRISFFETLARDLSDVCHR